MQHFELNKTLEVLKEHFYWPHMRNHVAKQCKNCIACLKVKLGIHSHSLYTAFTHPFRALG